MSFRAGRTGGNIATETVIEALGKRGAQLPPLKSLDALVRVTAEIGRGTQPQRRRIENAQKTTMNYKTLTLTLDSALATITLNRPDKRNAVSYELIDDLIRALDEVSKSSARILILTGAGKAFCSGLDLDDLKALIGRTPRKI